MGLLRRNYDVWIRGVGLWLFRFILLSVLQVMVSQVIQKVNSVALSIGPLAPSADTQRTRLDIALN
jgi:hypothetical protein